jgi:hypothetical protein
MRLGEILDRLIQCISSKRSQKGEWMHTKPAQTVIRNLLAYKFQTEQIEAVAANPEHRREAFGTVDRANM